MRASTFRRRAAILIVAAAALAAIAGGAPRPTAAEEGTVPFQLRSPAFEPGGEIPTRFTCQGRDVSPPLEWRDVPEGTRSLVLIVDDPDAPDPARPRMTWVHWVVYNIPPTAGGLEEAASGRALPEGAREGLNDWKRTGYGGPCPPIGRHRYFHKLYALDTTLSLTEPTKADVEKAMHGHVLAHTELIGTYEKR